MLGCVREAQEGIIGNVKMTVVWQAEDIRRKDSSQLPWAGAVFRAVCNVSWLMRRNEEKKQIHVRISSGADEKRKQSRKQVCRLRWKMIKQVSSDISGRVSAFWWTRDEKTDRDESQFKRS
jgi:hypothetical protein